MGSKGIGKRDACLVGSALHFLHGSYLELHRSERTQNKTHPQKSKDIELMVGGQEGKCEQSNEDGNACRKLEEESVWAGI